MKGRPLRFLGLLLGGWVAARAVVLWPTAVPPLPALVVALAPAAAAEPAGSSPGFPDGIGGAALPRQAPPSSPQRLSRPSAASINRNPAFPEPVTGRPGAGLTGVVPAGPPPPAPGQEPPPNLTPPLPPTRPAAAPGRLAGSLWAIGRSGGSDAAVPGAQLGGSQGGLRLTYALGAARRVALAARVSSPLEGRGREAALGVEWRPLDVPVRLLAEQRWSLDGNRGGPTLLVVGGLPPRRIGPFEAEGYAQAGAIARDRVDLFADGAARVAAPLTGGGMRLDLGIGAWGGAQPGAGRIDLGPTLGVGVPIAGRRVRITLDWRQRVAGRAQPGSGPAVSIGSDF